jgi:hypothetical protein
MRNLRHYGHTCRILVADDSSDSVAFRQTADAIVALGREFDVRAQYFGPRERLHFSDKLIQLGFDQDVVAFALDGWPAFDFGAAGASRNFLSLLAGDSAYASIDDDTECLFVESTNLRTGEVMFEGASARMDPASLRAFSSRKELLETLVVRDLDFVSAHQQLLGRAVGEQNEHLSKLQNHSKQVLVTLLGVAGDCGWGAPSRYFLYDDAISLAQLARSNSDWASTLTSRETLRVSDTYCVSNRADLMMTTAFAVDNRVLLPPFLPVGRGSDMLFGRMLPLIHGNSGFGHLPWAVIHSPVTTRRFWEGEFTRSAGITDITTMLYATLPTPPTEMSGPEALVSIGRSLTELARQSRTDFVSIVRDCVVGVLMPTLTDLELRADAVAESIPHWSSATREFVRRARARLGLKHSGIPAEFLYGSEFDCAAELARKLVGQFGQLLVSWADLRACFQRSL